MNEPTEQEYEQLYTNVFKWVVHIEDDGPVWHHAADTLLESLQRHCTHPCIFYPSQLPSLAFLLRQLFERKPGEGAKVLPTRQQFVEMYRLLLSQGNAGTLVDARTKAN